MSCLATALNFAWLCIDKSVPLPSKYYSKSCNGGYAKYELFVICTESEAFNRDQFAGGLRAQQQSITLHEYVHIVQLELAKGKLNDPKWLTEGFAEYVVFKSNDERGIISLSRELNWHRRKARKLPVSLKQLETFKDFQKYGDATSAGTSAVAQLVDRSGLEAFAEYWRLKGQRVGWKKAFERAFKISVKDFYATYSP